ncbi:hypothetical protein [Mycolicibacterium sp. P9-22]|uniref:hypothetical protein n=1 Tax=Mycolicibacterium sp. P9-22 TaxID=2024613 RepID=UPI0011EC8011|nr:hypothetical protein [Mycolicibacterium sp. P9-22]
MRSAVGASVLSTMLLIGGPAAVALADTGSDGSTSGSTTGTSGQGESSGTTKSGNDLGSGVRASLRQSLTSVRSAISPWTAQRPQPGFGGRPRTTIPTTPDSSATPNDLELTAPETAVTDPEASGPEQQPAPQPAITPVANSGTPKPAKPAGPPPARPVTVKAPLTYDKLPDVANTVGNTVASVLNSTHQTVAAVPALLGALPGSTTPVSDVITTIEFMLTTVGTSVGTIAALPGELGALMGVSTPPVAVIGVQPEARPITALSAPTDLPGLLMPQTPAIALGAGVLAPAPAAPVLSPATPVNVERMASITTAPLGVSGLTASGAPESFLDRAVSTLLVPISIATLAAVALPGVGGLLVICALGIRIGYRQAKAGWAIRVAGIARFAGSGPMGVVRSGSMITLHTKRPAVARTAGRLRLVDSSFEQAA